MIKRIVSMLLLACAATTSAAESWQSPLLKSHPQVGKIYDLTSQQVVSEETLLREIRKKDLVLIGEKHDNPDHHRLEARLLDALLPRNSSVVMEMLDDNQIQSGKVFQATDKSQDLKVALKWNDKGWSWDDYGPLVSQVSRSGNPLLSGNISRDQIKDIYARGQKALQQDERLSSALNVPSELREQLLDEVYTQHCKMMPKERLTPMVDIQLARDARMAYALNSIESAPAVLIAGSFHVRKDSAVPLHLNLQRADKSVAVVMLSEVDAIIKDYPTHLKTLTKSADYVWFTPRSTDEDYCERLKKYSKKHSNQK